MDHIAYNPFLHFSFFILYWLSITNDFLYLFRTIPSTSRDDENIYYGHQGFNFNELIIAMEEKEEAEPSNELFLIIK